MLREFVGWTAGDQVAAVPPRPGPEVDDPVGAPNGLLVVLHDYDGVADVAERDQRLQELRVVVLVQPDGGLVQDVEDADEPRAYLRRQSYSLGLAAGERPRRPVERQVVEADVRKEPEPLTDLLQDLLGDLLVGALERETVEEAHALLDGHRRDLVDGQLAHGDGQSLRPEPAHPRSRDRGRRP